jgi:hypothetical protein
MRFKRGNKFTQEAFLRTDGKTLHILENEGPGIKLGHDPHEFQNKAVPWIIQYPVSDQGKTLAWRATENTIYRPVAKTGRPSYVGARHMFDGAGYNFSVWKIEFMNSAMDGIDFYSRSNVKPGLLEPQA